MLDFKELSEDGLELEQLIRELLFNKGLRVYWSGKGPDAGKDLICIEELEGSFLPSIKTWLIQCKHKAHSGASVGIGELDDIVDSCTQHNATGYLLVTSTQPSSKVIERLDGISKNPSNNITATYWDAVKIERLLTTPKHWRIAQRFFPISANEAGWQLYATEKPNHWIVNFKGYYFHLSNRIGSRCEYHLNSISERISEIEKLEFPKKHFIRIRAIYFDDKNGNYIWFLDYMHPHDQRPVYAAPDIKEYLGDGYVQDDGQFYNYDVKVQQYLEHSDHYDPDHNDYYTDYIRNFTSGLERERDWKIWDADHKAEKRIDEYNEDRASNSFNKLCEALSLVPNIRVARAVNSSIEHLDKFCFLRNWYEIIKDLNIENDRFFSAWFFIEVYDEKEFINLINKLPFGVEAHFRLTKFYIVTPAGYDGDEDNLFEITISIHPAFVTNKFVGRDLLNKYFEELTQAIHEYVE